MTIFVIIGLLIENFAEDATVDVSALSLKISFFRKLPVLSEGLDCLQLV